MPSSPGFGSGACNWRPIQTRFPYASSSRLKLAAHAKSPAHASIGTPPHPCRAVTACKYTVSGSISLPSRGSFHRSLTVLSAIGHQTYLALRGGPRRFSHRSTNNDLLRYRRPAFPFPYGTVTLSGPFSQTARVSSSSACWRPYNPGVQVRRFGLFPFRSPLLRESMSLSVPRATEMFQFTRCPLPKECPLFPAGGFPHSEIRGSKLASSSPRLIAGSHVLLRLWCQGIHRVPFPS